MWTHTLAVGALIAGCAVAAAAQPGGRGERASEFLNAMFERLDSDASGAITAEEIATARLSVFQTADANADGVVDAAEVDALKQADPERSQRTGRGPGGRGPRGQGSDGDPFARIDANDDGLISQDEFVERPMRVLEFDADADGAVTQDEVREGMRARMAERFGAPPPAE